MRERDTSSGGRNRTAGRVVRPAFLAVAVWLVVGGVAFPAHSSTPPAPPSVVIHGATTEQRDRVAWALKRFEDENLPLPALDISFHKTRSGCNDNTGLVRSVEGVADIEICMPTKHILLHELAHAWAWGAVSKETRAVFAEYWELETWNDHAVDWKKRATEKAADTVAFALSDPPTHHSPTLQRFFCGYPHLVGQPLPFEAESVHAC